MPKLPIVLTEPKQKDARVLPDMGARVSFLEEINKNAANTPPLKGVLVPSSSIVQRDGKDVVFAIDNGRVHQRAVTPGQTRSDLRLVEGIAAGTKVVKQPPAELRDDAKVTIGAAGK